MKIKGRMLYTKKGGNGPSLRLGRPLNRVSPSLKLFRDCRVSLEVFIDCFYDNDYDGLIIAGNPTGEQLKEAWDQVYMNYCELSDSGHSAIVEKIKGVQGLAGKIALAEGIMIYISNHMYDEEMIAMLRDIGLPIPVTASSDFSGSVKIIVAYIKRWAMEKMVAEKQLADMQSEHAGVTPREYYDDTLDAISQIRKYAVLAKDISVAQFLKTVKKLQKQNGSSS